MAALQSRWKKSKTLNEQYGNFFIAFSGTCSHRIGGAKAQSRPAAAAASNAKSPKAAAAAPHLTPRLGKAAPIDIHHIHTETRQELETDLVKALKENRWSDDPNRNFTSLF